MLFSSISFLYYFLPIVIVIYFIVPRRHKNIVLFLSSMAFYCYGEPIYIFLMLTTILIAYYSAILIDKYKKSQKQKVYLMIPIIFSLGSLIYFKYSNFLIANINSLLNQKFKLHNIVMPIGISFYTFQLLSYVIDVYKGKVKVQKSFIKLATYVSLFPQLIAGPIVRYETIEDELENRKHSFEDFSQGAMRFVIGFAKKVLISNNLGKLCTLFTDVNEKTIILYWIYGISYSLQIYFDFSAYSDMAIGLGRIFGFHFLENFEYPYMSKSITEFWRRWHISLGSWFRDYVYIPLGGNKKGKIILIRNIFIVWFLTGFWHGANWTFVIWGLFFGTVLIIEKFFTGNILKKLPSIIQRIYVLFIVMISFIIFDSENIKEAFNNIIGLFGINGEKIINLETVYYLKSYCITLIISIIGATPLLKNLVIKLKSDYKIRKIINIFEPVTMVLLLCIVTSYLVANSYNPFLYFRF